MGEELRGEVRSDGMAREVLTDEQVEIEIERLRESEYVALAKAEERIRYKRRQYLYSLRNYEKKGRAMAAAGLTIEMLYGMELDTEDLDGQGKC